LLDIEYIFIFCAIRAFFLFPAIAVQVEQIDMLETFH